jgi:hypothetical protein
VDELLVPVLLLLPLLLPVSTKLAEGVAELRGAGLRSSRLTLMLSLLGVRQRPTGMRFGCTGAGQIIWLMVTLITLKEAEAKTTLRNVGS